MEKRGQISLFMIVSIAVVILAGILIYAYSSSSKKASSTAVQEITDAGSAGMVRKYAESCIKLAAEEGLFKRLGEQGGYIDVNANPKYGESGTAGSPISLAYTSFQGKNVPYYLEAYCEKVDCSQYATCAIPPCACIKQKCKSWNYREHMPTLDTISKRLANYIAVEFEECFKKNVFEETGIKIEKPVVDYQVINFDFSKSNVNVEVNFNEKGTSIKLTYPLAIRVVDTESKLDSFIVVLPIRLKPLFDGSKELVDDIKAHIKGISNTDYLSDAPFSIKQSDCPKYVKIESTNLFSKDGSDSKIAQFMDYTTDFDYYFNAYIFQFAVKNIKVEGNCAG